MSDSPYLTAPDDSPGKTKKSASITIPLVLLYPLAIGGVVSLVQMNVTLTQSVESNRQTQAMVQKTNDAIVSMQTEIAVARVKHENLDAVVRALQSQRGKP